MASEMLRLKSESGTYHTLSEMNRAYSRSYEFVGSVSRAVTGKLNVRKRALKVVHSISWAMLTYDTALDGGIGLMDLEQLVFSGEVYTLEVNRYPASGDWPEQYQVMFDPESFSSSLVKLKGHGRRVWQVSVTLLEV